MKFITYALVLVFMATQVALATPPTETGLASYYDDSFHGRKTASGEKYDKNKLTAAHKTLPFGTKVKIYNPANKKSVEVVINDRGPYIKGRVIELSKKAAQQIDLIKAGVAKVQITVLGKSASPAVATKSTKSTKSTATKLKATASKTKSSSKSSTKSTASTKPKTSPNMIVEAKDMKTGGLYKMQVLKLEAKGYGVQVAGYSDYQSVVQQLAVFQKNWFKGATVFVDEKDGKPYYKIILGPMNTKEEASAYCQSIKTKYKIKDAFVVNINALAGQK